MSQFREVQYMRENRIFAVIWLPAVIQWVLFVQQIIFGQQVGNQPAPDWFVILLWVLLGWGLPLMYFVTRLVTEVTTDEIVVRYIPFLTRKIAVDEIESAEATLYRPIMNYGGWGIRGITSNKRAYNVTGNRGVLLTLRNGKEVLIGSQRESELARAIQAVIES